MRVGRVLSRAMIGKHRILGPVIALLLFLTCAAPLAYAAEAAPAAAPAPAQTPPPEQTHPISAEELQRLVDTLQNDQDRAHLVEELRALIAAERAQQPTQQTPPETFVGTLSHQLNAVSGEILDTASVLVDAPRLVAWLGRQARDPEARQRWFKILIDLAIIFGAALAAEFAVRLLIASPARALSNRSNGSVSVRLVLTILRIILALLPIAGFAAAGYTALPFVHPQVETARVAEVVIRASVLVRTILIGLRLVLLTPHSMAALTGLEEETRTYLYIWARRFTAWTIYGFAIAEAAWWLGIPGGIYTTILKSVGLVLAVLAIILVLQNRQAVANWLRGKTEPTGGPPSDSGWRVLRQRLADTWHILVIVYIVGLFGVYALHIEGGFGFVLRATILSVVLIVGARLLARLVFRLAERGFAIGADLKARFPTLETRANRYMPVLSVIASTIIYLFAALALLLAWGVNAFAWFDSNFGRQFTGAALAIGLVILAALLIWEFFNSAIERYLTRMQDDAASPAHRARVRTLLPLLRSTMFITMAAMVTLIVLSQIGINTAPLLAGAGVIGLAVGFGSQALVKDVITGLFILIEDTLAVGDVVDVGGNHTGIVEALSIRTIRLRDQTGAVHTIPFSDVQTVKNMTKGHAYFVANIGVLMHEDPDRVINVLRETGEELAKNPALAPFILAPLEVIGIDRFTDSGMVIQIRIKVWPMRQWEIGREFNRLMKKAFDANGIEIPAVNQTHYLPEAPPPANPPAPPPGGVSANAPQPDPR